MKFAIIGHARSGTTTLQEVINLHPGLRVISEPFNKDRSSWGKDYIHLISYDPSETFDRVMVELNKDCHGFKHLIEQLPPALTKNILTHIPKIVWIQRNNLLQTAVSDQICQQANHWRRDRNKISSHNYTEIPLEKLIKAIEKWKIRTVETKKVITQLGIPTFELSYESFYSPTNNTKERTETIQHIFKFLEVAPIKKDKILGQIRNLLDPKTSKLNSFDTYRLIPNIDEIAALGCNDVGYLFSEV